MKSSRPPPPTAADQSSSLRLLPEQPPPLADSAPVQTQSRGGCTLLPLPSEGAPQPRRAPRSAPGSWREAEEDAGVPQHRFEIIHFQYGKEENLEGLLSHGNDVFNLELEADADVLMLGFLSKESRLHIRGYECPSSATSESSANTTSSMATTHLSDSKLPVIKNTTQPFFIIR
ncbi:5-hydroxytryptamine receptor 1F isoform X3 [Lepidochelys kempii]|uniref:5-hydroxytryptamine receptor 1F isoform X3 n=1 Tax=Lepidochelys kempii TaxID=8472 RepID=UPI003C6EC378